MSELIAQLEEHAARYRDHITKIRIDFPGVYIFDKPGRGEIPMTHGIASKPARPSTRRAVSDWRNSRFELSHSTRKVDAANYPSSSEE